MNGEDHDNSCGICFENLVEPRTLPCWHVACRRCILEMTQIGQGRAVTCHICRTAFLFENIRSLPRPINCKLCGKNVTNPKKFPCCNDLYCSECVRTAAVNGTCRNSCCPSVSELSAAKLCQVCFRLHTEPTRDCGHSLCSHCRTTPEGEPRPCTLCDAIAAPNPVPRNPQFPMAIYAQNSPQGMDALLEQRFGHFDERFIQFLGGGVGRNEAHRIQQQPLDPHRQNMRGLADDGEKVLVFYVTLALMLYRYGLCGWAWILPTLVLLSMRPRLRKVVEVCSETRNVMLVYAFYCHFYQAAIFMGLEVLFDIALKSTTGDARLGISLVFILLIYGIVILFFEPPFLHVLAASEVSSMIQHFFG